MATPISNSRVAQSTITRANNNNVGLTSFNQTTKTLSELNKIKDIDAITLGQIEDLKKSLGDELLNLFAGDILDSSFIEVADKITFVKSNICKYILEVLTNCDTQDLNQIHNQFVSYEFNQHDHNNTVVEYRGFSNMISGLLAELCENGTASNLSGAIFYNVRIPYKLPSSIQIIDGVEPMVTSTQQQFNQVTISQIAIRRSNGGAETTIGYSNSKHLFPKDIENNYSIMLNEVVSKDVEKKMIEQLSLKDLQSLIDQLKSSLQELLSKDSNELNSKRLDSCIMELSYYIEGVIGGLKSHCENMIEYAKDNSDNISVRLVEQILVKVPSSFDKIETPNYLNNRLELLKRMSNIVPDLIERAVIMDYPTQIDDVI